MIERNEHGNAPLRPSTSSKVRVLHNTQYTLSSATRRAELASSVPEGLPIKCLDYSNIRNILE